MRKRIIAVVLTIVLLVSMLPAVSVFSAEAQAPFNEGNSSPVPVSTSINTVITAPISITAPEPTAASASASAITPEKEISPILTPAPTLTPSPVSTVKKDDPDSSPSQIALAMTGDPKTSIGINWTTVDTSLNDAKVIVWEKGTDENSAKEFNANTLKRAVSGSTIKDCNNQAVTSKNFYWANATGLNPDTEYCYRCGTSGIMSGVKSFKTAQSNEDAYTFIYISDSQVGGNNSKGFNANLDIIKQKYPDAKFIYIAGDLTDTAANEGQWESFFNQPGNSQFNDKFTGSLISEIPLAAAMGNHDAPNGGIGGMASHYTWASQVEGVPVSYAFTYGAARFIILNLENAYSMNNPAALSAQRDFVTNEVEKAKAQGKFTIVGFHKSIYSGGDHMDDSDVISNRKYWSPIFAQIGVDAVLQGHDHILSRGFVKADGSKADVTVKVSGRNYAAAEPKNAPLYYVGNCGSTLKFYSMLTNNDWIKPGDPVAPDYGFLDLNSAAPSGSSLNPYGPCTDDALEGADPNYLRLPTFTAVTVSRASIRFDTYMTGFNRDTNSIVKDTFLYDSFTLNKRGPQITIAPYETKPTNKDITVYASTDEGQLDVSSHTFTENGSFTFTAANQAGISSSVTVEITNIDKAAPKITILPYDTRPTYNDITVKAQVEGGTLNESEHTFMENGSFTFTAADEAGNTESKTVTVSNIDKTLPVISILPYNTNITNKNVIVKAITNKGTLNTDQYTFTENGSFTFTATTRSGKKSYKTVKITNIDKKAPVITVLPYNTNFTRRVTVKALCDKDAVLNETAHVFTSNGSFTFIAVDKAGNKTTRKVTVSNIDNNPPSVNIYHKGSLLKDGKEIHQSPSVIFVVNSSDVQAGVKSYSVTLDGKAYIPGTKIRSLEPGNHTIKAYVVDFAGNTMLKSISFKIIN